MTPPLTEIKELRNALGTVRETVAVHSAQLLNGAKFREDLDALKDIGAERRLGKLETGMSDLAEAMAIQTTNVATMTASYGAGQVEQERRHSEMVGEMKANRDERAADRERDGELQVTLIGAAKDPKVLVLVGVIFVAMLAPETLPLLLHAGASYFGAQPSAPVAIEASELPE